MSKLYNVLEYASVEGSIWIIKKRSNGYVWESTTHGNIVIAGYLSNDLVDEKLFIWKLFYLSEEKTYVFYGIWRGNTIQKKVVHLFVFQSLNLLLDYMFDKQSVNSDQYIEPYNKYILTTHSDGVWYIKKNEANHYFWVNTKGLFGGVAFVINDMYKFWDTTNICLIPRTKLFNKLFVK
jgi:hypothetical protein